MPRNYVIYDIETGGLDPKNDALMSVAILVLDGTTLTEIDRFYTVVKDPGKNVDKDALKVNGLTPDEIQNGMPINIVIDEIRNLVIRAKTEDGYPIMTAHNAAFDAGFLNERGANIQYTVDTMWLSRWKFPYQKATLKALCERLGVVQTNAHNAMGDVLATADCLRALVLKTGKFPNPMPLSRLNELNTDFVKKLDEYKARKAKSASQNAPLQPAVV
jgi:DNA polymerase III, alpha subunit (gram-positive type)